MKKGRNQPAPCKQVAHLPHHQAEVTWYGSSRKELTCVTHTGLWYGPRDGQVVPIRWVCVVAEQESENDYFYCSDPEMDAARIIERYAPPGAM